MEPGGSLLCSQEYAAWIVYSLTHYFLKVQFNMILPLTLTMEYLPSVLSTNSNQTYQKFILI